jgi:hypothetical protein
MFYATPRPLYPWEKVPIPIEERLDMTQNRSEWVRREEKFSSMRFKPRTVQA